MKWLTFDLVSLINEDPQQFGILTLFHKRKLLGRRERGEIFDRARHAEPHLRMLGLLRAAAIDHNVSPFERDHGAWSDLAERGQEMADASWAIDDLHNHRQMYSESRLRAVEKAAFEIEAHNPVHHRCAGEAFGPGTLDDPLRQRMKITVFII